MSDAEPFVCTLPLAPRSQIAGAFRPQLRSCVFCRQLCGDGDLIACPEHRKLLDAEVMPWETRRSDR